MFLPLYLYITLKPILNTYVCPLLYNNNVQHMLKKILIFDNNFRDYTQISPSEILSETRVNKFHKS